MSYDQDKRWIFIHYINPNRTRLFFDIFRFGGGGGGGGAASPSLSSLFVALSQQNFVGIGNQSISLHKEKLHNVNDVINNDLIIVRKIAEKTVTRA